MHTPRILVVENDVHYVPVLRRILGERYELMETRSAESALDLVLDGYQFDLIVADMGLDGWSGGDLYRRLSRRRDPHACRLVILSGLDVRAAHPALANDLGDRILAKPIAAPDLLAALEDIMARAAA
jgi:CheY-like chemotaxis protein